MSNHVIYMRVSTERQGKSGLSLSEQEHICRSHVESKGGTVVGIYKDVKSGTSRTRKGLWDAIKYCKETKSVLTIAKIDRLARDAEFTFKVLNMEIEVYFCDFPEMNTFVLGIMASYAQYERERISSNTKDALRAYVRKGGKLGAANDKYSIKKDGLSIEEHMSECRKISAQVRREQALDNPNNKRAIALIDGLRSKGGYTWQGIADMLNKSGFVSSTGKAFTRGSAYNLYLRRS